MSHIRALLAAATSILLPSQAHAQINPCPLGNAIPCGGGGAGGLSGFVSGSIIPEMQIAFAGILLIFFIAYSIRLIAESGEESTVTEIKAAYGHAVTGAIIVSLMALIVSGIGNDAQSTLLNSDQGGPLTTAISTVIAYAKAVAGIAVMVFIVVQAIRLIMFYGTDEMEKQRQRFFHAILGLAAIMLANIIVSAVLPGGSPSIIGTQMTDILNLILEVIGIFVVLSFIIGGLFLILSTSDTLKDRAKKIMFTAGLALITVFLCFVMVNFFLSA